MRVPRDLSGPELIRRLGRLGYAVICISTMTPCASRSSAKRGCACRCIICRRLSASVMLRRPAHVGRARIDALCNALMVLKYRDSWHT